MNFFRARLFLADTGDPPEIEVWDDELTPTTDTGTRPIRDWAREHLGNWNNEEIRERFGLPATGNYEVLFTATIRGWFCNFSGEWDEEVDIKEEQTQQLPNDYFGP